MTTAVQTAAKDLSASPYKIVEKDGQFQVVNNMGKVKATFKTKEAARQYQKALYANVPGAAKLAQNKPFTGDAKRRSAAALLDGEAETYLQRARNFTQNRRETLAKSGAAMPDGSYPIENADDLRNALLAFGRAKDKPKAKAHITKRANALKMSAKLPDSWKTS